MQELAFSQSFTGAQASGIILSLIETAKSRKIFKLPASEAAQRGSFKLGNT
jgi:hypothetical protein|uniref:hypothetical protein n=1 Tax=Lactobacillus helveticus TaxID=1587 RepID=UPI00283AB5CF|nr:hypothetical protein [Lactobacillus helveticus]